MRCPKGKQTAPRNSKTKEPADPMDAHDVSPIVNSAKYDGPECIQPVSDDEISRGAQLSLL